MASSGLEIFFDGTNLSRLLNGMLLVAKISVVSLVIGFFLGIIFGMLRTSESNIIKFIFRLYLEIFRVMPLLVLLFLFYYILPEIFATSISNITVSIIVFVLWISSEMSDIVRSTLISIPKTQIDAGRAIGLSKVQQYRYIYLPQGLRLIIPASLNLITRVIKTTSILLIIGVPEMIKVGQQIIEHYTIKIPTASLWVYGLIFILYFILCWPISWLANQLERQVGK
ncbi:MULTISPECIES: amino acid ABC transporter permease [Pseudolactococcus]|uniref:Probable glutamine ABC transporter permease protein 5 GlnP5 n=1 Tax=Pseudolactococcus piscium MKFS47 TaxID=297352 RepID=A0A0D6DVA3_9LACT|nr:MULTISPECIES: amino acid ABC transporter permease [Lactococcus]MCJ1969252.1 amino acid ABC transporter permease [Lactococcus carnosus]MCJ1973351.1 amino acid ABC transporter permease [Lactococcus carnosus]MCJ1975908.1 amino acid ABC transporter permease [Lactococcus carnosus]MCJ1986153.1 amino acid ABC transporter permease [Lactococcus carnosus]CEN27661.1 Probable glutamine ABC transporter permease protein 5 GlnP5 [Lactococcus piscium MKFS47]